MDEVNKTLYAEIPLYKQITTQLENGILAGTFLPGHRIPSARELAVQYQVNPNTAQRAVRELKQEGLLVSPRGKGTLVTDDGEFIHQFKQKRCEELTHSFLQQMKMLGYSHEQLQAMSLKLLRDDG